MAFRFDPARTTLIYRLIDPRDGRTRYIGYTQKDILERWKQHVYYAKRGGKYSRDRWIRDVLSDDEIPHIEELDFGVWSEETASHREDYWIQSFGGPFGALTNEKPGGIGSREVVFSKEARNAISAASKADWQDPGYRENFSRKSAEYWDGNDRARAAVSRQTKERWADPDCAARKTLQSPEYRAQRSEIAKEIFNRPEMRKLLSENGKKNASLRRRCEECGRISTPAGIGTHQKSLGHSGTTDMPTGTPKRGGDS